MIWNKPLTMLWTISFMRGLPALIEPAYDAENLFVLRSLCDFYTYGNILNSQCGFCSLSSFLQRLSVVLDRRMGAGRAAPISDRKSEQELRFSTISSPEMSVKKAVGSYFLRSPCNAPNLPSHTIFVRVVDRLRCPIRPHNGRPQNCPGPPSSRDAMRG
jgi:hypothetical protein